MTCAMASEKVSFYNPDTDTIIELNLSEEDARRATNDITFATTLMNSAIQQQKSEMQQNDDPTPTNTIEQCVLSMVQPQTHSFSSAEVGKLLAVASTSKSGSISLLPSAVEDDSEEGNSIYRWSSPCVILLLESYRRMEDKFTNGKFSQKKIWEEIAEIFKTKGYNITGPQCAAKFRSLKKSYKSIKDHNNKSGNDKRTWQFYEIMDEIFSKKAWCNPVALASSSGLSIKNCEQELNKTGGSNKECTEEPLTSKSQKFNLCSLLGKRLKQKEEHEEARAKRHKSKMEMDEKLLSVLEKLVDK